MSLTVTFNQCVDLAVNPSQGTINTSLLNNLLHIIINQLQLSKNFIEFHGAGSAAIENHIVNNHQHCEIEINEFEMEEEVDEATGNKLKKRREIKKEDEKIDESTAKLFSVRNVANDCEYPMGYPLSPIQVLSIEQMQIRQRNSIHDVMANVLPSDDKIINAEKSENPLKAMLDYINVSKRLDALEIGTRQLAEVMKTSKCEDKKSEEAEVMKIDSMIASLTVKVNDLSEQIKGFKCKCSDDEFEENLMKLFSEKLSQEVTNLLTPLKTKTADLENANTAAMEELQQNLARFKEEVCQTLDSFKNDLIKSLKEIQDMLDAKVDKFSIPELKQYLQSMIKSIDEKVENIDIKKALAAGAAKKIFNDLNCVSCGENVIQADARNPTQAMLKRSDEIHLRHNNITEIQLLKSLPTRLCGGNHTITTPRERIFLSANCQN